MRANPRVVGGIVGICIVLVAVVVIGQGSPKNPSEKETYQDALNDLAVTGNRNMPRSTLVSALSLTHASAAPGALIYDYTFSTRATVDSAAVTSAISTLATQNCSVEINQELVFNRGLTLRMNLRDSSGVLLFSRDLKKAGCPERDSH